MESWGSSYLVFVVGMSLDSVAIAYALTCKGLARMIVSVNGVVLVFLERGCFGGSDGDGVVD